MKKTTEAKATAKSKAIQPQKPPPTHARQELAALVDGIVTKGAAFPATPAMTSLPLRSAESGARDFTRTVPVKVEVTPENGPSTRYDDTIDMSTGNPAQVSVPEGWPSGDLSLGRPCRSMTVMKTINLDDLDEKTGEWLREAVHHEHVVVMDQGRPLANVFALQAAKPTERGGFHQRVLLPEYAAIMNQPVGGTDSSAILEQDREDRL